MKKANKIFILSAFLLTFMLTKTINAMQNTEEIWKEITTHKGYFISNTGKVRSPKGKIRKTKLARSYEYIRISLSDSGASIHRIVAIHFIPNPNGYKEINHKDGNKLNNHVSNLEWCTRSENCRHAIDSGLRIVTFSPIDILIIREAFDYGYRQCDIARYYNVRRSTISGILNKRSWATLISQ